MKVNQEKIGHTFEMYYNGNRKDAAKKVRGFNKLELVEALTRWACNKYIAQVLCSNGEAIYNWEQFVYWALQGSE